MLKNSMFFDTVILKIILESSLSETTKNLTIDIIKENANEMYGHFSVGEVYESIKSLLMLDSDLKKLNITNNKILKALVYNVIRHHCLTNKELNRDLIQVFLEDSDFRNQLLQIDNPQSWIVEFLKNAVNLVHELFILMAERKSYLVIKKYQEIIYYCRNCGIDLELFDDNKKAELSEILSKKFPISSIYRHSSNFKNQLKKAKFCQEEIYSPENFNYIETFNPEEYFLQKLLHEKMVEYYRENQCIVLPYNKNINIYYLRNLVIVAYRYDDIPKMNLQRGGLAIEWSDRDFWAIISYPNVDFLNDENINYIIEERLEYFKVVPKEFDRSFFKSLGTNVIFTPENYLDEAIIKHLTEDGTNTLNINLKERMKIHGIPTECPTDKLWTSNNRFFFKNPTLFDELEVENITEHKYLSLIKSKKDKSSRNKCIAALIANYKKNPKLPDNKKDKKTKSYNYEKKFKPQNFNQWLPYKDD